ncbi:hypothetical protein GCM10008955_13580 [Deinococcus malanensis]|uniref:Uncharacterized protein n=1 Tax=Deinococcus malanensis TaxID=1706855 RepID=A0ABQ2EQH7_9DEIO|nr:hypothetical protein GCM10008955_13580 [Deinococcus malanensis]
MFRSGPTRRAPSSPGASLWLSAATTQPAAPRAARMSELLEVKEARRNMALTLNPVQITFQDCPVTVQAGQKPPDRMVGWKT